MRDTRDAIVVGGGLAGLTAAIHLARAGREVTVVEARHYPQHKVCGEYVSNEVLPYFERLGIPVRSWQPREVRRFRLHARSGRSVEAELPLGGFGIRRYTLDHHLYRIARSLDVPFLLDTTARDVAHEGEHVRVELEGGDRLCARAVIGSFGKRSNLDRSLGRPFARQRATHLGVKFYLRTSFPDDVVALYGFDGGYAGAVRVEDGTVDVAYLTTDRRLRDHGGLAGFEEQVLQRNPALKELLASATRVDERPLTISNVSFGRKEQVVRHALLIGDAAGMILPLCGNGMAMGVHGAKLAAEAVLAHLEGRLDRATMERRFRDAWRERFASRLFWGRRLHPLLSRPELSEVAVRTFRLLPGLLQAVIARTHGQAFA